MCFVDLAVWPYIVYLNIGTLQREGWARGVWASKEKAKLEQVLKGDGWLVGISI